MRQHDRCRRIRDGKFGTDVLKSFIQLHHSCAVFEDLTRRFGGHSQTLFHKLRIAFGFLGKRVGFGERFKCFGIPCDAGEQLFSQAVSLFADGA